MSNNKTKTLQIYFPDNKKEDYNFCMATLRRIQSKEEAKGNKCKIGDAVYILCKHHNEKEGIEIV